MNKNITINGKTYKMYQAPTGWIFIRSAKTKKTYSVAKIVDNVVVELDAQGTIDGLDNNEIAAAWLNQ